MAREFDFVDPFTRREVCEEDYTSPAWPDEEEAYTSTGEGTVVTLI